MNNPVKAGQRFGLLVTVSSLPAAAGKHRKWLCKCDCGGSATWQSNNLKSGTNPSCGCAIPYAYTVHGGHGTREYDSWRSAIERCCNPQSKDYPRYGGRGITMCEAWRNQFAAFRADMGPRPEGTTLDRWPDTNGNYEPGNCRWATATEQARNRRNSVYVDGTHLSEIAADKGITYGAAYQRQQRGTL